MTNQNTATQKIVDIEHIKNGVVYLKNGGIRKILIVSGINFDLKSEDEQTLILNTFQNFLNSLDFSVQFFIHSRKVNIDGYLKKMSIRKEEEENELLKIQIEEYIDFIKSFIEDNNIINKSFFISVPYNPVNVKNESFKILGFLKRKKGNTKKENNRSELEQLNHRVEHVTNGLEQIGLRVVPLEDGEITELFYNLYNPGLIEKKGLKITKENLK